MRETAICVNRKKMYKCSSLLPYYQFEGNEQPIKNNNDSF